MEISKHDWKVFREQLPVWQERYMEKLCEEYIQLLSKDEKGSTRFWALEKRIKEDRRKSGVIVNIRKSDTTYILIELLNDGAITLDDLKVFSESLQEAIQYIWNR